MDYECSKIHIRKIEISHNNTVMLIDNKMFGKFTRPSVYITLYGSTGTQRPTLF